MHPVVMSPAPGERVLRFVGDTLRFEFRSAAPDGPSEDVQVFLRTNLGRAAKQRREIIGAHTRELPLAGASWRDIAMRRAGTLWTVDYPLAEVGYFKAKAYAVDANGWQYWPEGSDVGITVHPDRYRTANVIYCAFTRLFGGTRERATTQDPALESLLTQLDRQEFTVIPPSGKLRDLTRMVPHIFRTLGCRILHLLPINPTPTTSARLGRFGSPYAALDFTAIDPALVEFDRRTTGADQFGELAYAVHAEGSRLFLDLAINHTGWGSTLQENHPEWFLRSPDGQFLSPGAWGVTWEDLVELAHRTPELWDNLAEAFLVWCRRGVDGFRCDAGYKVPLAAWQYIIARVRQEFPESMFLLEGLGGSWEATESLLDEGGMQWAYSELFQNYSGREVAVYLDYSLAQSRRRGLWVHYSETHDNARLAAQGRAWSLLRNRLCALTSVSGAFGYTCGVEWLAEEKIQVHGSTGLSWDNPQNLVAELARLSTLLSDHPCFYDGAATERLSPIESPVYALRRTSWDGTDRVLVLVNTDARHQQSLDLPESDLQDLGALKWDLLDQPMPDIVKKGDRSRRFKLLPAAAHCLASSPVPRGLGGQAYRQARARAAWGLACLCQVLPAENVGANDWQSLSSWIEQHGPLAFLAALGRLNPESTRSHLIQSLDAAAAALAYPLIARWSLADRSRILLVPPGHWLLIEDTVPFRATLQTPSGEFVRHLESVPISHQHIACLAPDSTTGDVSLTLLRFVETDRHVQAGLRFLSGQPCWPFPSDPSSPPPPDVPRDAVVLLTNGRGGMARLSVDLGRVQSKYDCVLAANLHPEYPVDRQVLVKRIRVWVNADGFLSPLDAQNLAAFVPGPPAAWQFVANAGDGRCVEIYLTSDMLQDINATILRFTRPSGAPRRGNDLAPDCRVTLTVRVDLEDRSFHAETRRNPGAEHHFASHTRSLDGQAGYEFTPTPERRLRVVADQGLYHPQPEWCENLPHRLEQSRGQVGAGDAFSPGWFELPLARGAAATLVLYADSTPPSADLIQHFGEARQRFHDRALQRAQADAGDAWGQQLVRAAQAFVARRGQGLTVIAGYPWFLDWGRDSLICARGLLAAGLQDEVFQLLLTFGQFAKNGTLPNSIHGDNAANRDTSDAPLWYGLVCEEVVAKAGVALYQTYVDPDRRTLLEVLGDVANGYLAGTPNGIRMDPESGLIWSPAHFTWMDTNYPAGTPREGYPVEIQVLWIRLLRQLDRLTQAAEFSRQQPVIQPVAGESWKFWAERAEAAFHQYFWLEDRGYYADGLLAARHLSAQAATPDTALRSNYLLAVSLDLVRGVQARRSVEAALRHLVVPGALRSLAPLPVTPPLPIQAPDGRLLNQPDFPYWGHYEGDEDTRRKPAYHNGTAWVWTFPIFCEALAKAWDCEPAAVAAAKAYLSSADRLLSEGCLGHLPEIVDGDAPHLQRGCDAQAWSVTETWRVWKWLRGQS